MVASGADPGSDRRGEGVASGYRFGRDRGGNRHGAGSQADKVAEYRAGRDKLYGFFVGQVMRATQGKANPTLVNELLKKKLASV